MWKITNLKVFFTHYGLLSTFSKVHSKALIFTLRAVKNILEFKINHPALLPLNNKVLSLNPAWGLCGVSRLFPQSKNMHISLTGDSNLPLVALSSQLLSDHMTIQYVYKTIQFRLGLFGTDSKKYK